MRKSIWFSSLCLILLTSAIKAQENGDKILITIGDEKVSRVEFERIYLKNNQMVSETDRKTLEEYLDLFIIYKLKVAEAIAQGLDKTPEFKQELNGYRSQLVQPYLTDKETERKLQEEAYERMKYEVSASHILINVPEKTTPEDTLLLYEKTLKIRERIMNGEPFDLVAKATSDDPSVKRNGGLLGYFSAFQMVYPFECAAYQTSTGSISMPVRTRFGYHIVKVNDKRPSLGQIKTAHIMITVPQNATQEQQLKAKERIDSISMLVQIEDFASLARRFSQDPGSARTGGELPFFGPGRMVPEFEKAAFDLQVEGQVSSPVRTPYGWHIIKLLEKKYIGTFEETLPEIKNKISRDERSRISRNVFMNQMKEKHGFSMDSASLKKMVTLLDESFYNGDWTVPSSKALNQVLFQFAGKEYTLSKLATKFFENQKPQTRIPLSVLVERFYNELVEETILSFEEERLVKENPDFYFLLKEYYDGILLFEIMDRSVWSKASTDSEGLRDFHLKNLSKYKWDKRIHTYVYSSTTETVAKKAHKLASSKKGINLTNSEFVARFTENGNELITINEFAAIPENPLVKGYNTWKNGLSPIQKSEQVFSFHRFVNVEVDEPIPIDEIRGQLIADYQEFLEKEWIASLREKHKVEINKDVFNEISASLN
jgi:peptidyl-prolyl cis-trans isomerase SurA